MDRKSKAWMAKRGGKGSKEERNEEGEGSGSRQDPRAGKVQGRVWGLGGGANGVSDGGLANRLGE